MHVGGLDIDSDGSSYRCRHPPSHPPPNSPILGRTVRRISVCTSPCRVHGPRLPGGVVVVAPVAAKRAKRVHSFPPIPPERLVGRRTLVQPLLYFARLGEASPRPRPNNALPLLGAGGSIGSLCSSPSGARHDSLPDPRPPSASHRRLTGARCASPRKDGFVSDRTPKNGPRPRGCGICHDRAPAVPTATANTIALP
jgi:hypothetical protein